SRTMGSSSTTSTLPDAPATAMGSRYFRPAGPEPSGWQSFATVSRTVRASRCERGMLLGVALTPLRISHGSLQALAGALAAGSALAVGELVAGFAAAGPSLVTAVGDEFIDRFAGSLKELAVSLFGRRDKVALVVGIVVVALAVGAWV